MEGSNDRARFCSGISTDRNGAERLLSGSDPGAEMIFLLNDCEMVDDGQDEPTS